MKSLFEATMVEEVKGRMVLLRPDSERLWGKMNVAQVMAHCSAGFEMAAGKIRPPRKLIGLLIGRIIKPLALGNDEPMRKESPTVEGLIVKDDRDFEGERERLVGLLDRFVAKGPEGCTEHPHAFFGRLTGEQWGVLMYKHMDHHLRQFGV